jgi:hypothetical protein|eukprot:COSAG01_NODE_60_length_29981_cov_23.262533_15_plen_39_part_00
MQTSEAPFITVNDTPTDGAPPQLHRCLFFYRIYSPLPS